MRLKSRWLHWLRFGWPAVVGGVGTIVLLFLIPTPYIVYEPGSVASTRPMVHTAAETEEEGVFLLTTVRWTYANVLKYVTAYYDKDEEILEKDAVTRGASRSDYIRRQNLSMRASHSNAIEAAYRLLDIPYAIQSEEIVVYGVMKGLSADGVLRPGDRIVGIDGRPVRESDDLAAVLEGKSAGDEVTVTYRREDAEHERRLVLRALPDTEPPRPGMGITFDVMQSVVSARPEHRVSIEAGDIGGPSAGIMFALEIYNRLTKEDWTKGYVIAGTGEISPDGTVGPIGGVVHKVTGAHRRGADIFFVPRSNAEAAERKAAELGTAMDIVPVGSLREAVDYLEALPVKETRTGGT